MEQHTQIHINPQTHLKIYGKGDELLAEITYGQISDIPNLEQELYKSRMISNMYYLLSKIVAKVESEPTDGAYANGFMKGMAGESEQMGNPHACLQGSLFEKVINNSVMCPPAHPKYNAVEISKFKKGWEAGYILRKWAKLQASLEDDSKALSVVDYETTNLLDSN